MSILKYMLIASSLGMAIGGAATEALRAQATPPACLMAEIDISDPEAYKAYSARAPSAAVEPFGGPCLVRAGATETLDGDPAKRMIIISFPNTASAKRY